ncbi:MAG: Lrp/AsnC family transcriptional regulator [Gammaproteobacteria bacterium]|nr:Lrp/AsnC family transcriptional regulator [Gammaproteobacteria bacterium]
MLTQLDKQLLNDYQQGMPLVSEPYAEIAREINLKGFSVTEQDIIDCFSSLKERGMISRVGPVFQPKSVGGSTLAAIAVPEARMDEVADIVSSFSQVNHNYEREHEFNLWFVVTASSQKEVEQVLQEIEHKTALSVMNLPMEQDYHIDLGFPLWC